jgi:hypothetical protein
MPFFFYISPHTSQDNDTNYIDGEKGHLIECLIGLHNKLK